jgi:hypothetical protein
MQTMSNYTDTNDLVDAANSITHRYCKGYKAGNLSTLQDFMFAAAVDKRLDFWNGQDNRFVAGFSTPTGSTTDFRLTMLRSGGNGWVDSFLVKQDSGCCGPNAYQWDQPHGIMGVYHLWVDASGRLRIKNGAPTSDADGAIVGTQS